MQRRGAIRRGAGRTGSLDSGQSPSTDPREKPKRGQTFPLRSGDVRLLPSKPDTQEQPAAKGTPLDITSTDNPKTEGNYQEKDQIIAQKAKILQSQISKLNRFYTSMSNLPEEKSAERKGELRAEEDKLHANLLNTYNEIKKLDPSLYQI